MIRAQSHRPYLPPATPWILAQTWWDVLFAHWAVPFSQLRSVVPEPLPLDSYEGKYWVGVVAFGIQDFRPRWLLPVPKLSAFPEVNFRTYVTIDDKPGVYFFSLDVNSLPSVIGARLFYHLPYFQARMTYRKTGQHVRFNSERQWKSHRADFDAEYSSTGESAPPAPGSLDYWLTERYCLYALDRKHRVHRAEIDHAAWKLQSANATIHTNTLALAAGITLPDDAPLLHYAERQDAMFWYPSRFE